MTDYGEEHLAALLQLLPPAPVGWVTAAQELPRTRAELDDLVARAGRDEAFRASALADLEAAVRGAGIAPTPSVLVHLRRHLCP